MGDSMSTIINATTTNGVVIQPDNSGSLELQTNSGTTALTISTAQNATFAGTVTLPTGTLYPLVSGTEVASTSGTSIDFTGIPSWVKQITVMFSGVSTSGSSDWLIQLGDAGGIETTGYLGTGTSIQAGTGETLYTAGFGIRSGSAANICHGAVIISQLNASSNAWVAQGVLGQSNVARTLLTGGGKPLSATLDRIRITTVNGTDTFDAGSINILYE
jgi:hypothetical protein